MLTHNQLRTSLIAAIQEANQAEYKRMVRGNKLEPFLEQMTGLYVQSVEDATDKIWSKWAVREDEDKVQQINMETLEAERVALEQVAEEIRATIGSQPAN